MKTYLRFAMNLLVAGCLLLVTAAASSHAPMRMTDNPNPPDSVVKLVFIHHSTGENWLTDDYGNLGKTLGQNNYFVSDTNYGWGPNVIGDRTDIPNWTEWFASADTPTYMNALLAENDKHSNYTRTLANPGGQNEIIMFKSCFPNSALEGSPNDLPDPTVGLTVGHAKYVYNTILDYFATRQDKLFVIITAPPLSDGTYAANARAFNNWLVYHWLYENNYTFSNVVVFDFYNVLTHAQYHHDFISGMVRHKFGAHNTLAYPSGDDHPSVAGSQKATNEFVPLLNVYYRRWKNGAHNIAFKSNLTQDGWVLESAQGSGVGGSVNSAATTIRLGDDAQNRQYAAILSFNTSSLPDNAVIVSAMVKVKLNTLTGQNPFNWTTGMLFDIRKGPFNGNSALEAGDLQATPTSYSEAWFNKYAVHNWLNATVDSLSGHGDFSDINLRGITQLRLRFAKETNNNNTADYRSFFSGNSAYKPVLWITYYVP
jgi:hypothetical protein